MRIHITWEEKKNVINVFNILDKRDEDEAYDEDDGQPRQAQCQSQ